MGGFDKLSFILRLLDGRSHDNRFWPKFVHLAKHTFIYRILGTSTSISANADGPRDAASLKIDYIALSTEYNYQATSVGWQQIAT